MDRWSLGAWEAALPVYRKIIEHPFVGELAAGTLAAERFEYYLRQDALYLDCYAKVLAHIASRAGRKEHTAAFVRFASDGIAVEEALHASYLRGAVPSPEEMSPACMLYTSVLRSQAAEPLAVEAAAVLPCFWVYQRVGEAILARQCGAENPYARWIATYADPSFAEATARAVAICDELAAEAGADVRARMTEIFVRCARMEWLFWDSAYRLEKWKI